MLTAPGGAGSPTGPPGSRLQGRTFYGIILGGVVVGAAICVATGWAYLKLGGDRPAGRRIWDGIADQFVVPICVMIGATFGGLAGLVTAIAIDVRKRRGHSN